MVCTVLKVFSGESKVVVDIASVYGMYCFECL